MVLDNLSDKLKDSLKKITKIGLVDKKAVIELSADIKKALVSADVNISLAKEISQKIRDRGTSEAPPKGLTTREHVVNIVFEELTNFLGKEFREIEIKKKPTKILLCGLFGSGKCVHPDSQIALSDGRILTAEQAYNQLSKGLPKEFEKDSEIIDISENNILIPSFNPKTLKIENKKITHVWKLQGKELLRVFLDNGNDFSVRVTPEHPFFILRNGELKQVRADELNEDDFVAIPRRYEYQSNQVNLFRELQQLDLNVKIGNKEELIIDKSLNQTVKELPYKRNYCKFTLNLKRGIAPIYLVKEPTCSILKIRHNFTQKFVTFPRYLTQDLAEFIGYVIGDGHIGKNYIQVFTENKEIIQRIKYLSKSLFGFEAVVKRDLRTKNLHRISIDSKTLVIIFNKIFKIPIGKKGVSLKVPNQIMQSDLDTIHQFIKAYFDCDSHIANNSRVIDIISESKPLIKEISTLLLRFGIISAISKKTINEKDYARLTIRARYAETYANKIGFRIKYKQERADKFETFGLKQGCGKQDVIPIAGMLKQIRSNLGFSIGEIQNNVTSYGLYESKGLISRESLFKTYDYIAENEIGRISRILGAIQNNITDSEISQHVINGAIKQLVIEGLVKKDANQLILTKKALQLLNQNSQSEALTYLNNLATADVCWSGVSKIEVGGNPEYVYDFTVEDNHSFIADGIIVHNTTTAGKLGRYYKKQGRKVALVQTDTWRPAAFAQLKQLAEAMKVDFFGNSSAKKPEQIVREFEKEFSRYDVVIIDTAGRDALNKELISEIQAINKAVKPDEALLVLSGDIGQGAQTQAEAFHKNVGVTGVVVTKLDGTAKGGGALTACSATGTNVKFIGTGEKMDAIEEFKPKNFVSRLLGMGDLETLLKKAESAIDKDKAEAMAKKVVKGKGLSLQDLYDQMEAMQKMGPLSQIMGMMPGMGGAIPKDALKGQEKKMKGWKYLLDSMTKEEKENPEIMNASRIARIARGSGRDERDVRELLKQYKMMQKMMKSVGSPQKMKQLSGLLKGKGLPDLKGLKL